MATMSLIHARCESALSHEMAQTLQLRLANSGTSVARRPSSVVHTYHVCLFYVHLKKKKEEEEEEEEEEEKMEEKRNMGQARDNSKQRVKKTSVLV